MAKTIDSQDELSERLRHLESADWGNRRSACVELGNARDATAVPALVQALEDYHCRVREAACQALASIGDPVVVPALAQRSADGWECVRRAVCVALGRFGDPAAAPALAKCADDASWHVRQAACEALGHIIDPAAAAALVKALHDEKEKVRDAAYAAMGRITSPAATPALVNALEDEDWSVRTAACDALGRIGGRAAVRALVNALEDEFWPFGWAACDALGRIGDPAAAPALVNALRKGSRVRIHACGALGRVGNKRAIEPLIRLLDDGEQGIRQAAKDALTSLASVWTADAFARCLGECKLEARVFCCEALARVGNAEVVPTLVKRLDDESLSVRGSARQALLSLVEAAAAGHRKVERMAGEMLCAADLSRFREETIKLKPFKTMRWFGCPVCGKVAVTGGAGMVTGVKQVVAVIDQAMTDPHVLRDGTLIANWLLHRSLFDFDSVEIVKAKEIDVEKFCVQVRNDTDLERRKRCKTMECRIRAGLELRENTIRNLRAVFGAVVRV
jgi:HEAT repeat protein